MDSHQKDDSLKRPRAHARNSSALMPISDFLENYYFIEYKKVYKVCDCLIAALYMYYRDPESQEGKFALNKANLLVQILPNTEKFKEENTPGTGMKYFEISSFLLGNKDSFYWYNRKPLGQFKLPVFEGDGWLEVPGDSIIFQTHIQIIEEFKDDLEYLKRMENKIRFIYINRIINSLLDEEHFDFEVTLDKLEELGLPKREAKKSIDFESEYW